MVDILNHSQKIKNNLKKILKDTNKTSKILEKKIYPDSRIEYVLMRW